MKLLATVNAFTVNGAGTGFNISVNYIDTAGLGHGGVVGIAVPATATNAEMRAAVGNAIRTDAIANYAMTFTGAGDEIRLAGLFDEAIL